MEKATSEEYQNHEVEQMAPTFERTRWLKYYSPNPWKLKLSQRIIRSHFLVPRSVGSCHSRFITQAQILIDVVDLEVITERDTAEWMRQMCHTGGVDVVARWW